MEFELLATAPSVEYEVQLRGGTVLRIDNPSDLPSPGEIEEIREPWLRHLHHCPGALHRRASWNWSRGGGETTESSSTSIPIASS